MTCPEHSIALKQSYLAWLKDANIDRQLNQDPHTVNTLQHMLPVLEWIHTNLKRQDMAASFSGEAHDVALEHYRTFVLDMGRQGGNAMLAQLLCNEDTLLFDATDYSDLVGYRVQGIPAIDESIYAHLKKAKVVKNDTAAFMAELDTNKYVTVVIYGTRSLSRFIGEGTAKEYTTRSFRDTLFYSPNRENLKHVLIIG